MHNKRLWALLLALLLALSAAAPASAAKQEQTAEETAAAEPETELETIYIASAEDLLALSKNCRLDTWSVGKRVVLQRNISLEGVEFQPIPLFGGIFDGNGCTISGLYLDESMAPAGLFGRLQTTGIVMDLTVSGTVIPSGDAVHVGGIVGENYGTVTDCSFTGALLGESCTGGIAGMNALTGKIVRCGAVGTVAGSDMTGGIAGSNLGVISSSVNQAHVNTISVDPSVDPSEISFDFLTDVSKLTSLDTSMTTMDTGSIAGYSSGIIESCTNQASVGYPHIGYNVGGIAGRSCGYIHDCSNTAEIFGRKDVGGIAGQMEPYIARNLTESSIAKLQRQLDELDALLDQAVSHGEDTANSVVNRLKGIADAAGAADSAAQDLKTTGIVTGSVSAGGEGSGGGSIDIQTGSGGELHAGLPEGVISAEGNTSGSGAVGAEAQISISTNLGGIASALYGLSGQMGLLGGELEGASDQLKADAERIRAKISEITETGFALVLGDGEEDIITDGSEQNIDGITLGKVSDCVNSAAVNGDINIGGIAGAMAMEYALDPEDDITVSTDHSQRRKYEVKAVIYRCENTGTVTAKRNHTGGIAGKMDLGLIDLCESYGTVSSESGNYVGGIAGIGGSTIRRSFVKCTLSGNQYVGGVVGSGVQEDKNGDSSTVAACCSMVTITACKQYAGTVSGGEAGTFLENYFASEDLAGINRMSRAGEAEPLSYEELLALFAENEGAGETAAEPATAAAAMALPEEFRTFTLKFVADDAVIDSCLFDYGASFGADTFPQIPAKDGYYAHWDQTELKDLTFDTVVSAVYVPCISALESAEQREDGRPVFFVEGAFDGCGQLTADAVAVSAADFDLARCIWDLIRGGFTRGTVNTEVVEQWQLAIPPDASGTHTVRYLPPDGKEDRMDVYVLLDGAWKQAETKVAGSYITFPVTEDAEEIAIVSTVQMGWVWIAAGVLLFLLLLLAVRLIRRLSRRTNKAAVPAGVSGREGGQEEIIRVPPPVTDRKKKRWITPLLVILALLIGIGGTAAYFLLPDRLADKKAFDLLKAYSEKPELSMSLTVDALLGGDTYTFCGEIDRVQAEGTAVTVISAEGKSLYYADGAVILENGNAYALSDEFPDYSRLLERAMELVRHVEIDGADGVYTVTAGGADAEAILEILFPAAGEVFPETDALQVELITAGGELTAISFRADADRFALDAALDLLDSPRGVTVPGAVLDTVKSGEYGSLDKLSGEVFRLFGAWENRNSGDAWAAALTLEADCGPLKLKEDLTLFRWNTDADPIFGLEENGYALYFGNGKICDSKGNTVPSSSVDLDIAQLLDIVYAASLGADAQCVQSGNRYTYTVTLDEEGMKVVACAIAPEAETQEITFESGRIKIIVADDTLEYASVSVGGSVNVVLGKVSAGFHAEIDFTEGRDVPPLPQKAEEALQTEKSVQPRAAGSSALGRGLEAADKNSVLLSARNGK